MKLPPFGYYRPSSVPEAIEVLQRFDDAKVLAGGQSLLPVMALRMSTLEHIVDIGGIPELGELSVGAEGARIGAMVRQLTVERDGDAAATVPLLAAALPLIGHRAIRNRGTVCGSLAHADPAAELPAVAVTLGAEFVIEGPSGQRVVPASEFFVSYLTTAIAQDEMLVEVRFPRAAAGHGAAVMEMSRRSGDFAIVGAAAAVTLEDERITTAAVSLFGVGGTPVRLPEVEAMLVGASPSDAEAFAEAGQTARRSVEPVADDHGSTAYKQQLAAVMTRRSLSEASRRAKEAQ